MTLRTALVIDGDGTGAEKALAGVDQAMEDTSRETRELGNANAEATEDIAKLAKTQAEAAQEMARGAKGMGAASAEAAAYAKAYATADAAIEQLANAQAEAAREIASAKAALKSGEDGLESYNRKVLQTKAALSLVEAEHRSAMSELQKASASLKPANDNLDELGQRSSAAAFAARNLNFQLMDMAQGLALGMPPMMILMQQVPQAADAFMMLAKESGGAGSAIAGLAMKFGPVLAVAGLVAGAIGLMTAEINKNSDVTVTWQDTALGAYDAVKAYVEEKLVAAFEFFGVSSEDVWGKVVNAAKWAINWLIGAATLAPRALIAAFQTLPAGIADAFYSAVNLGIGAINGLLRKAAEAVNTFAASMNNILPEGWKIPRVTAAQIAPVNNDYAGAGAKFGKTMLKALTDTVNRDFMGEGAAAISPYSIKRAEAREAEKAKKVGAAAGRAAGRAAAQATGEEFAKNLLSDIAGANATMQKALAGTVGKALGDALQASWNDFVNNLQGADFGDTSAINSYYDALARLRDVAAEIDLQGVFGDVGDVFAGIADAVDRAATAQERYADAIVKAYSFAREEDRAAAMAKADAAYSAAKLATTVQMIGATKKLFAEQSAGYQIMAAAEKAAGAIALINTAKNVALGASKIFASLGPFGFPVVAAMIAVMAGLGFKGGSGGGGYKPPSAEDVQAAIGTGTVLGDNSAQSESLANALDIIASNTNEDLEYSNAMVRHLRSIDSGIGTLTAQVARQLNLSGGAFDTSGFKLGQSGSSGILGLFGSSTTRSLWDQGIEVFQSSVDELLTEGLNAQVYNVIQQIKKSNGFLGIGGGTKTTYQTVTGDVPAQIEEQMRLIVADVSASVVAFGQQLGVDVSEEVRRVMIPGVKLSFKDMSGEEIEQALQAYFSSVADQLSVVLDGANGVDLSALQRAGEGLFETLARVTRTMMTVETSLASIGMGPISVGNNYGLGVTMPAMDDLVNQFGGLDEFQDSIGRFADEFLTEAERMAPIVTAVRAEMERLGASGVETNDQFKQLVQGLNLGTEEGRALFGQLMAVAPAFAKVTEYMGSLNAELEASGKTAEQLAAIARRSRELDIELAEAQGRTADARRMRDEDALAALDESLHAKQREIWATRDAADAARELADAAEEMAQKAAAAASRMASLEIRLAQTEGRTDDVKKLTRDQELADAQSDAERAMLERIYAAEDAAERARIAAEAQAAAAEAAAQAQSAAIDLARQQAELEIELMRIRGHETAARAREEKMRLDALPPQLALIQKAIFEEQRLAEARAKAAEIAKQATDFDIRILELTGRGEEAKLLRQAQELALVPEQLRARQQLIWALEAATTAETERTNAITSAKSAVVAAYNREGKAMQDTVKRLTDLGTGLRQFRETIFAPQEGTADSYRQAQVKLITTSALANTGDEKAAAELANVGKAFLTASLASSSTAEQYQRDQAMVARAVDQAISVNDEAADIAQASYEAMTEMVGHLVDLNATEQSVLEAVEALRQAQADGANAPLAAPITPVGVPLPAVNPVVTSLQQSNDTLRTEVAGLRADMKAVLVAVKLDTGKLADIFKLADRDGSIAITIESDETAEVEA